ncbi:hypothetical protein FRB90_010196 [Tulasnella sp. 427]|nr:hypothetical protein FRB90_010196 [Tulasnella sp. 427]
MGLLDTVKDQAKAIAKSANKNSLEGTFRRARDEVQGLWNPNHRHDEAHEIEADERRARICDSHRFKSFAPERQNNTVKWYIDGADYFYAVSELIDSATECIFILDWWLSPEIYLRRPPADNEEWRLDRLLKRKAEQGVKVYVIVYKEVTQTSANSSRHTKNALQELHPNVLVQRHPDHIGAVDTVKLWSHHEKLLVVDCNRACIGGLDLCFGRWDTHSHPLADAHPTDFSRTVFPGQDYNNGRVMDYVKVDNYSSNQISILETGRMPWHDVHMSFVGSAVEDCVQHFVERWNEIKKRKNRDNEKYDWLEFPGDPSTNPSHPGDPRQHLKNYAGGTQKLRARWDDFKERHDIGRHNRMPEAENYMDGPNPYANVRGTCNVQVLRSVSDWSHGVLVERSIQNAYIQMIREANHFIYIENQFFISNAGDKGPIENRIAEALVERILSAARSGQKFKVFVVIPEVPGFAGDIKQQDGLKTIMAAQWRTINRGGGSIYEKIRDAGYEPLDYIRFYHLRGYDRINAPASFITEIERNSGVTFFDAQVAKARTLIGDDGFWFENFCQIKRPSAFSGLDDANLGMTEKQSTEEVQVSQYPPTTQAAREVVQRYESGAPRTDVMVADSIAQHRLQDRTSLLDERWMGNEQEERDCYISELIYIHSKLMIVDDRRVIMGSANINDRSQKGNGDSEIALVVEDTDMIETTMEGKPYMAARFAATLRRKLFREHLGLIYPQTCVGGERVTNSMRAPPHPQEDETRLQEDYIVADPLSEDFLGLWYATARVNREVYSQIFKSVPTDNVRNWDQYKRYVPKVKAGHVACDLPLAQIKERLAKVRGGLVEAPLNFLIEQKELVDWSGPMPSLPIFI